MADPSTTDPTTPSPADVLDALESAARSALEASGASLVTVGRNGRGSGFVVAPGRVLTNAHNLRDRTTQLTFADGRAVQAALVAADLHGDLVVLEADTGDAAPLEWADDAPALGAVVFAAARSHRGLRLTVGTVSGVDRPFRGPGGRPIAGAIEHTAPMAPGSSGGPLLDRHGRVAGVNTHRLGRGFYLAVPAGDDLRRRVDDLAAGTSPRQLTIGVAVAPSEVARRLRRSVGLPERDGLLVRGVDDDGPSARGGVQPGDLLVSAAGRDLAAPDDLFEVLGSHDPATPLVLGVVRGADELTVEVRFDEPGEEPQD
jgi:S1-C subfamily serine protease